MSTPLSVQEREKLAAQIESASSVDLVWGGPENGKARAMMLEEVGMIVAALRTPLNAAAPVTRSVVSIAVIPEDEILHPRLYAACDDGTMWWRFLHETEWSEALASPIPGTLAEAHNG